MASTMIENIIAQINQLPASERAKLIEALKKQEDEVQGVIPPSKPVKPPVEFLDRTLEYEWLARHQLKYVGQWVALSGNQLIAHGQTAKEVFARAQELRVKRPLVLLVEDPNLPFAGI
ncbi:MAG TPA: DUF5678 domain-containing protein [Blastocatellia bacterium]|nr:DUF5678 domain-containing protein [Blastocatellia bacterium]